MRRTQAQIHEEVKLYSIQEMDGRWYGMKKCNECGKIAKQTAMVKSILIRNMRKSCLCRVCSNTGDKNGFFGKKHTAETKSTVSASRTGKATGEGNSMAKAENRQKVSEVLTKLWASADMDHQKEKSRQSMIRKIEANLMVTAPVSKEEKQLKEVLEAHGFVVESQFRIGTLKYDLLIEDRKVIVEFHGDYWHANPNKYAPDYMNKKKNMYAHEIWAHDVRKKALAEANGYRLITVWDSEYKKNKNYITQLINEIKD